MTNARHQPLAILAVIFAIRMFAIRRVESRSDNQDIFSI
jgi:hypothetical protein